MKELDLNVDELPFRNFLSSRYMISSKVNVENIWKYSKENHLSFFNLSLAILMNAVNKVPQLKRRIIKDKVVEYEYLEGICPIMNEEKAIFREMKVQIPQDFKNIIDWHDYVQQLKLDVLEGRIGTFELDLDKRDETNIANFSCIPWIDFEAATNAVSASDAVQPLITWGKVNEDYEMTVSITVSHIFVSGRDLGYFFQYVQEGFDNLI